MRIAIILTWKKVGGLALLGAAGALFLGWSGLVSIAASSGHFAVTRWFLGWAMENAIETQSMLLSKPKNVNLKDPALVRRSAGHYATGCAPCHGAPGVPQSPVVLQMTPSPPRLEDKVGEWSDEELFWIVKHGIKYSGMPAWPTQEREDEVWAQIAFLRALPAMTRTDYAELALGGPADHDLEAGGETTAALDGIVENAIADCARCHDRDGLGRGEGNAEGAFPIIAGQPAPYLYATLRAFALGRRESGFMEPPASRYPPEVLEAVARHYSEQPAPGAPVDAADASVSPAHSDAGISHINGAPAIELPLSSVSVELPLVPVDPRQDKAGLLETEGALPYPMVPEAAAADLPTTRKKVLELGRRIAVEGIGPRKIPACQRCHGPAVHRKSPYYPYLAGQPEWYLSGQLRLWQEGRRGGTAYAHLMDEIARNMTDQQIEAVSAWYSELPVAERYQPLTTR